MPSKGQPTIIPSWATISAGLMSAPSHRSDYVGQASRAPLTLRESRNKSTKRWFRIPDPKDPTLAKDGSRTLPVSLGGVK
jgi:hypothetical protein